MIKNIFLLSALYLIITSPFLYSQESDRGSVTLFNKDDISAKPQNIYALIVGISTYPNLRPLKYADQDAILFKEFLRSKAGGLVPESNIQILLNEKATAPNFWLQGIKWLSEKAPKKGDRIYIYLAGHGDAISSSEYFFLTYDCQPGNDKNNYLITGNVQLYNLKSRIQKMTASGAEVILIMDACRTGDLPGGSEGVSYFSQSIMDMKAGEILLLSAGPNQSAYEDKSFGGGHGLFTYYLINGLSGLADEDGDAIVTLVELEAYVKSNVRVSSKEKYKILQIPQFCCPQNEMVELSSADKEFKDYIAKLGFMGDVYKSNTELANTKRSVSVFADSSLIKLYAQISEAINMERFNGTGNARIYLDSMITRCNTCELTNLAKRELAAAYLNYGQAKINLYVSGKENEYQQRIILSSSNKESKDTTAKSLLALNEEKFISLAQASYKSAAVYIKDALMLLDNDEFYNKMYKSKIDFLEIYNERNDINKERKSYWLDKLSKLLKQDSSAYMLNLAGLINLKLELYENALEYFKMTMVVAPRWTYPVNNLGMTLFKMNNYSEAESTLLKAVKMDSSYLFPYTNLGILYANMDRYEEAEQWLMKAVNMDAVKSQGYNNLGSLYFLMNDYKMAEVSYKKAIESDSSYIAARLNLDYLYAVQKDEQKQKDEEKYQEGLKLFEGMSQIKLKDSTEIAKEMRIKEELIKKRFSGQVQEKDIDNSKAEEMKRIKEDVAAKESTETKSETKDKQVDKKKSKKELKEFLNKNWVMPVSSPAPGTSNPSTR